jgi:hypothetical protein
MPFDSSFARDAWATQRSASLRCARALRLRCKTLIVASTSIPLCYLRIGSSPAALAHCESNGVRHARRRAAAGWIAGRDRLEGRGLSRHRNHVECDGLHARFRLAECRNRKRASQRSRAIRQTRCGFPRRERIAATRLPRCREPRRSRPAIQTDNSVPA